MKKTLCSCRLSLLAALLLAPHFAGATVYTWNWTNGVSADMNWSDTNNWSPAAIPANGDAVIFNSSNSLDVAAGPGLNVTGGGQAQINPANFNSIIDSGFAGTISSLVCSNLGGTYQNILLSSNFTLNITNSAGVIIGNGTTPGSGGNEYGTTTQFVTIAGTNATLKVNNTNALFWVTLGSNAGGSPVNTLDMSALDNFNATVSRVLIGVPALNPPRRHRLSGRHQQHHRRIPDRLDRNQRHRRHRRHRHRRPHLQQRRQLLPLSRTGEQHQGRHDLHRPPEVNSRPDVL